MKCNNARLWKILMCFRWPSHSVWCQTDCKNCFHEGLCALFARVKPFPISKDGVKDGLKIIYRTVCAGCSNTETRWDHSWYAVGIEEFLHPFLFSSQTPLGVVIFSVLEFPSLPLCAHLSFFLFHSLPSSVISTLNSFPFAMITALYLGSSLQVITAIHFTFSF